MSRARDAYRSRRYARSRGPRLDGVRRGEIAVGLWPGGPVLPPCLKLHEQEWVTSAELGPGRWSRGCSCSGAPCRPISRGILCCMCMIRPDRCTQRPSSRIPIFCAQLISGFRAVFARARARDVREASEGGFSRSRARISRTRSARRASCAPGIPPDGRARPADFAASGLLPHTPASRGRPIIAGAPGGGAIFRGFAFIHRESRAPSASYDAREL